MTGGPSGRPIAMALAAVVLIVVGVGLYLVGSPGTARQEALDQRRVEDLLATTSQVRAYQRARGALPATLQAVDSVSGDSTQRRDPVTGAPYEYRVTGDSTYDLCATFTYPSTDRQRTDDSWRHPAGRHCFPIDTRR